MRMVESHLQEFIQHRRIWLRLTLGEGAGYYNFDLIRRHKVYLTFSPIKATYIDDPSATFKIVNHKSATN